MPEVSAALRELVRARAANRCEYCGIAESGTFAEHEIDHIIALKHGGDSLAGNLALSCVLCNRHKGSDIASIDPFTGLVEALFHPRRDTWADHFALEDVHINGKTPSGRVTARLLQFNRPERVRERAP